MNRKLTALTGEEIRVIGASRTDSGVHALGNVAVFDTRSTIPPERMAPALNQKLPDDIVIVQSEEVPLTWHPRYQEQITKTYEYHIYNARTANPLKKRTSTYVYFPLDVEKMRAGASYLVGEHDFASFCCIRTSAEDTVRAHRQPGDRGSIPVRRALFSYSTKDAREIVIRVTGNGFLYNMVRIIAGTLIRVGRGFYPPEKVGEILAAKVRTRGGASPRRLRGLCCWRSGTSSPNISASDRKGKLICAPSFAWDQIEARSVLPIIRFRISISVWRMPSRPM